MNNFFFKKLLICTFLFVISFNCFSQIEDDQKYDVVLRALNNHCGDTWCEGEFDFEFYDVYINENHSIAKIEFSLIHSSAAGYLTYRVFCSIKNISSTNDILDFSSFPPRLIDSFINRFNSCVMLKEKEFHQMLNN